MIGQELVSKSNKEALEGATAEYLKVLDATITKQERLTSIRDSVKQSAKLKAEVELQVSTLNADKMALEGNIKQLIARRNVLERDITELDNIYAGKEAEKQLQLDKLDKKVLRATQELDKAQGDQDITRDRLATWERSLETRDKNIRIREAKVSQGENRLLQNSELLNL